MVMAGQVEKDGVEPGVNGGAALEPMNRSNGLEECVLHEVLGVGLIAAQHEGGTKQSISISVDQFLHGPAVLTLEGRDKLILIHDTFVPFRGKRFKESAQIRGCDPIARSEPHCVLTAGGVPSALPRLPREARRPP